MKNLCSITDLFRPRKLKGGVLGAVVSACAVIAGPAHAAENSTVGGEHTEANRQVSGQQDSPYTAFLAKYVEWVKTIEAEGQARGVALTPKQIELATRIGIEHPEKVRLVYVDAVPFPSDDPQMRKIGEELGFVGPGITNNAQAFGYTIWVRDGFDLTWPLLAHELVHVQQIERNSSFGVYVEKYMTQLTTYGHENMPLEVEAYEANRTYASETLMGAGDGGEREAKAD
ncbi:hypothetical protein [Erythrobacter sp.]|uniref:hypothetical protein n=1 Tax=Erythrobacter sp. TaxID=1042 RepID=UPI001B1493F4|nr:hypothetical protein [Erythrobacter sp.]MBO6525908.1 hypothetical protein [Erythrobacter sp.]MBO6529417.1 hypothetical protein [Erythrobacter sp.]